MKIVIITQARMTSTRLPGKVLKEVLGKPLLQYQIERLRRVPSASDVVVATTVNELDDAVVDLCRKLNCAVYRGAEYDVLGRCYHAAMTHNADVVVRVTSDCPLIDPCVIEQIIQFYLYHANQYDYVSNTVKRTYPRGMDTEVFPFQILEEAFREASLDYEREHVTPFLYTHQDRFRIGSVMYHTDVSHQRWTVDTPEDFELLRKIIEALDGLHPSFTLEDTLKLVEQHPKWTLFNGHVEQEKSGSMGLML